MYATEKGRSAAADNGARTAGVRNPGARPSGQPRAVASSQRRLVILAGTLAALVAVFAFIYWRAVSGPGPGSRLPMVPMPASGVLPTAQTGAQQTAAIPVTPYVTSPGSELAAPASDTVTAAAAPAATGMPPGAGTASSQAPQANAAPPSSPPAAVTVPTPEQLAAITDPAIRAEAMRDANERAARQVRMEGASAPGPAPPPATAAQAVERPAVRPLRQAPARPGAATAEATRPVPPTAVGENGDVRFVRSAGTMQVAPAVQNGYTAIQGGDLATARQQYDLALLQDPNNRDALLGSAAVALREHDGKQASAYYLRLLELDPNDPEALAGMAELRAGDLQTSEIKLRGLARQHPESGPVQFALGNLYARQGRWAEAQQSYFRAFSAIPDNADYAFNLGVGLDRMNQPRLAANYYRRALELAQAVQPGFNIDAVRKRLQVLETPAH